MKEEEEEEAVALLLLVPCPINDFRLSACSTYASCALRMRLRPNDDTPTLGRCWSSRFSRLCVAAAYKWRCNKFCPCVVAPEFCANKNRAASMRKNACREASLENVDAFSSALLLLLILFKMVLLVCGAGEMSMGEERAREPGESLGVWSRAELFFGSSEKKARMLLTGIWYYN